MRQIDFANQTQCPVARAANIAGDIWSLLVLRELFSANHRFDEIQAMTGATPQMVAARLKRLEAEGLVERRQYNQRPARYEYHLTGKGADFFPVMMALAAWGEKWTRRPGEQRSVEYTHVTCGKPAGLGPQCDNCGEPLHHENVTRTLSPAAATEREARRAAFKESRSRGGKS